MSTENDLSNTLDILTHIAETLNRAIDVRSVLNHTLADLVRLMNLDTGWIFVRDPAAQHPRGGNGYVLAAHHNLPPALDIDGSDAWHDGCRCQDLCDESCLYEAYNEVRCSRLENATGDRRGLVLHASTPLRSGDRILGILNVAGPDQNSFSPQALTVLTNVGNQMGIALERARLFDLLQERRIQEQAVLLELSNQLLGRRDLTDRISYLVEEVRKVLQADACALLLPAHEGDFLEFRAASGWHTDPVMAALQVTNTGPNSPGTIMRAGQPLFIEDIQRESEASWQSAWRHEGFRGHAVVPLVAEGTAAGVLILNMRQPRRLDDDEIRLLRLMANQAAIAIENARLQQEEIWKQGMERELKIGREIQASLLPQALPDVPGWEFAVYYRAARQVGGDFYDYFPLPGETGRMGLVIADVAGKGVPAALFMALSRTTIRATAQSYSSPAAALREANKLILNDSQSGLFVTAFYAVLETASGRLVFSNAGHNRPLWHHAATREFQELATKGTVLGVFGHVDLEECEIDVAPGDLLVFYTDGVTEAMSASHHFFGESRLRSAIGRRVETSAQEVASAIVEAAEAFTGDTPRSDDCTLLIVRRCE